MSKKSKQCSTSSPAAEIIASNIDLLTEILLRVSAKLLIKFKSVSKQWFSLISDSRFGRNHTLQNPSSPLSGLYFYSEQHPPLRLVHQITRFSVHNHPPTTLPNLSFLDASRSVSVKWVFHSANGLLLCSNFHNYVHTDTDYIVCNLTTRKFKLLSAPVVSKSFNKLGSYLVFDPKKSPHYKVVAVSSSYKSNCSQFDVYSSQNASWKSLILAPIHNHSTIHGAVWNGEIILMGCSESDWGISCADWGSSCADWGSSCAEHDHFCIRFDIDAEKLTTTRLLYSDYRLDRHILYFGECSTGHLLLIQSFGNDVTNFEVLEMVEGENNFRWTVKYTADLTQLILPHRSSWFFSVMSVINVGANENDLALVLNIQGSVMQYSLKCKTLKVLCHKYCNHNHSFQFIESLMPV